MAKRILLAGVAGGLVLFVWGAVSHMVLGLGEIGISTIPNEDAVLAALKDNLSAPGFYFFPGEDVSGTDRTEEQMQRWEEKYRSGPIGILVYDPVGEAPLSPARLLNELLLNIAAALLAAVVLSQVTSVGFFRQVGLAGAFALIAALDIHGSYWNWYRFPVQYTLVGSLDLLMGWLAAGAAMAWLLGSRR